MRRLWRLLLVLMMVGTMVGTTVPTPASASYMYHREKKYVVKSAVWPYPTWYWVKLAVDWQVRSAAECNNLYPCFGTIRWLPDYGNGLYKFDHWFTPVNESGQYTNGIKWKSRIVGAQFKHCFVDIGNQEVCLHDEGYVKILIRTNGTSDVWYWREG